MILALIRFFDKSLSTLKQITLFKGQYLLSSILEVVSEIIFIYIVVGITNDNSLGTVLLIAFAGGLGKYITCQLNDRFSKDKEYINRITSSAENRNEVLKLYKLCSKKGIKSVLLDSYDYTLEPNYTLEIYAKTKVDSRIIDKFINECDCKMLRKII